MAFVAASTALLGALCPQAAIADPLPRSLAPHRVYVTEEFGGKLAIIDGRTGKVTATLPLGKRPRGLRLAPGGHELYVALSGSPIAGPGVDEKSLPPSDKTADGIGVVDLRQGQGLLTKVLRGVSDPEQLAVSADGGRLYIASEDTGSARAIDARTGAALGDAKVGGEPEGVAVRPDGEVVYVTSEEAGTVSALDARSLAVLASVKVGRRPRGVAFAPDGARAYITCENEGILVVLDAKKHEQVGIVHFSGANARPMGVVVAADGRTIYVTTGRGKTVEAVDAATLTVKASVEVGERPWGIGLSPDGKLLYTANGPSDDVSVVDARTLKLLMKIKTPGRPWGIAIGAGS